MALNQSAFEAWCAAREMDMVNLVCDQDLFDQTMAEYIKEEEERKKEGGQSENESSSSISFLVTVKSDGSIVRADAYSFGKGKSGELDVLKTKHATIVVALQSAGIQAETTGFRLDTTARDALLAYPELLELSVQLKPEKNVKS